MVQLKPTAISYLTTPALHHGFMILNSSRSLDSKVYQYDMTRWIQDINKPETNLNL